MSDILSSARIYFRVLTFNRHRYTLDKDFLSEIGESGEDHDVLSKELPRRDEDKNR